jgi:hypothetical protein
METIIREGEPKLKDSRVGTGSRLKVSKIRNSQGAWIHGESTQELENKISRKLELVTGLVVIPETASEKLYLVSYSFGGQYSLHQDTVTFGLAATSRFMLHVDLPTLSVLACYHR